MIYKRNDPNPDNAPKAQGTLKLRWCAVLKKFHLNFLLISLETTNSANINFHYITQTELHHITSTRLFNGDSVISSYLLPETGDPSP